MSSPQVLVSLDPLPLEAYPIEIARATGYLQISLQLPCRLASVALLSSRGIRGVQHMFTPRRKANDYDGRHLEHGAHPTVCLES